MSKRTLIYGGYVMNDVDGDAKLYDSDEEYTSYIKATGSSDNNAYTIGMKHLF